jgi:NAD(P)-dependent dehydrogenase (short-subunit alcohol dehydrogenase family)
MTQPFSGSRVIVIEASSGLRLATAAAFAHQGATVVMALGTVIAISSPETRAETVAGLVLAAYLGLSVPAVGAGIALTLTTPRVTLLGFALLVALGIFAAGSRLLRREPAPSTVRAATVTADASLFPGPRGFASACAPATFSARVYKRLGAGDG